MCVAQGESAIFVSQTSGKNKEIKPVYKMVLSPKRTKASPN